MNRSSRLLTGSVIILFVGFLLLSRLAMGAYGAESTIAGIPALYIHVFTAWLVLVVSTGLLFNAGPRPPHEK